MHSCPTIAGDAKTKCLAEGSSLCKNVNRNRLALRKISVMIACYKIRISLRIAFFILRNSLIRNFTERDTLSDTGIRTGVQMSVLFTDNYFISIYLIMEIFSSILNTWA